MRTIEVNQAPIGEMQVFNSLFYDMPTEDVERLVDFNKRWYPYGYDEALFCRDIATVFMIRK